MGMTADAIISHKDTLRHNPPDILLTNYKMLDYLLIRAKGLSVVAIQRAGVLALSGRGRAAHL